MTPRVTNAATVSDTVTCFALIIVLACNIFFLGFLVHIWSEYVRDITYDVDFDNFNYGNKYDDD